MADSPHRRLTDRVSSTPTFIGAGSIFKGDLKCEGDLVVGGAVTGDGIVRGGVTLSGDGSWHGTVEASSAVIAGTVQGALLIADKLEIRKTARVHGTVRAKSIAVAQGALIDGEMSVTSGAPIVTYEEKRKS